VASDFPDRSGISLEDHGNMGLTNPNQVALCTESYEKLLSLALTHFRQDIMSMNEFRRLAAKIDQHMQQLAAQGVSEAHAIINRMLGV
jgi:hypothetical protein